MTDTIEGVHRALNDLVSAMLGKGLIKPDASFRVAANASSRLYLSWDKKHAEGYVPDNGEYKSFTASDTADQAFLDARSFIEAMPSKAERDRAMFMDNLAETIEIGKRIGIEDGYVNPLLDMMKKLSENALGGPSA